VETRITMRMREMVRRDYTNKLRRWRGMTKIMKMMGRRKRKKKILIKIKRKRNKIQKLKKRK